MPKGRETLAGQGTKEDTTMKFLREDNRVTFCGEHPIDRNNPEQAATAVEIGRAHV